MAVDHLYRRFAETALVETLTDTPAVLIHGPRQCGKTTLARRVGEARDYAYFSFDDDVTLAAARADPVGFVGELPDRVVLDEVQRAPGIFPALKSAVDRRRTPGRFLLTGSANVLLLPALADSLAGRLGLLRLHPLAQCELAAREPGFLDLLFGGGFKARKFDRLGKALAERIAAGGYPAALARSTARRRAVWYRDYIETLVQRDVRDLARIASLDTLPRLLALAAGQTARLINISDLASPFQLSRPTIRDYVTLLGQVFLIDELPPWHSNRLSRLIKTPKLHIGDTGLACALLGIDSAGLWQDRTGFGQLLETFVYQELRRHASWHDGDIRFSHFRDKDGAEVDLVLERGSGQIAGVEVKAAATVIATDFRGLRKLKEAAGRKFTTGIVLYDGEASVGFGEGMHAVPIRMLWE
jgi:predicted AAA+ superfamily ATPase